MSLGTAELSALIDTIDDNQGKLDLLSNLLLYPQTTHLIMNNYRPILIELVGRIIEKHLVSSNEIVNPILPQFQIEGLAWWPESWFPDMFISRLFISNPQTIIIGLFSNILPTLPQVVSFCTFFLDSQSDYINNLVLSITDIYHKRFIMRSVFRLLTIAPHTYAVYFKWDTFYKFLLQESDIYAKAYCAHIVSFLSSMSPAERTEFIRIHINTVNSINLEILPYIELKYNQDYMAEMETNESNLSDILDLTSSDYCSLVTDIYCGILLPNINILYSNSILSILQDSDYIITNTVKINLKTLAQSVSIQLPVLIQGDSGSGKTSLISHLSTKISKHDLLKIHLGDQTDCKILLGSYVCSETPGVFYWKDGLLTSAVKLGSWVLIEDIDLAPNEVLSILIPLLETRTLFISERAEEIKASQDFRIFATRTSTGLALDSSVENLWFKIHLKNIPDLETREISFSKFKSISHLLNPILDTFFKIKQFSIENRNFNRVLSIADLFKWCRRIVSLVNNSNNHQINEDILRESYDVFICHIENTLFKRTCFLLISECLGIASYRAEFYLDTFVPSLTEIDEDSVSIGRVVLYSSTIPQNSTFAHTKQSNRLIEKLAIAVKLNEKVNLVGETGTGKTTTVQYLASIMHKKLVVFNMSQQSESSDFFGGYKPIEPTMIARPLYDQFINLFSKTFNSEKNEDFIQTITKAFMKKKWKHLFIGFRNAIKLVNNMISQTTNDTNVNEQQSSKKLKSNINTDKWSSFETELKKSEIQIDKMDSGLLFSFVEGSLVKAVKNGDWVLLDEINLSSPETLECLSGLLQQGSDSSLLLFERDNLLIKPHPEFRLFACMNPANDAGKHDLPPGIKSRFTEIWVDMNDMDIQDLVLIIKQFLFSYLPPANDGHQIAIDIANFYIKAKEMSTSSENIILDGANRPIIYSTRTLTRALSFAISVIQIYGLIRSLYEGIIMNFITQANHESRKSLLKLLESALLSQVKNPAHFLKQVPNFSQRSTENYTLFGNFWLKRGPLVCLSEEEIPGYVITESVKLKLNDVARGIMSQKYPILIQGPTSAGKTSMIEYIAQRTGHRFVRINNHEHTDLDEYLGSYVPDDNGKLIFQDGALVEALKKGHWVVLDELNLAPTDILEALNRLLDDNRELFVAETQEVVKPHPNFLLFATQNPPGVYAGRKVLSRAFRNSWANRHASGYQNLAQDGFMILGERTRSDEDLDIVLKCIEETLKVKLNIKEMYQKKFQVILEQSQVESNLVWTNAMKRMLVLIMACIEFDEPVLLVGDTGSGKTSVCQFIASYLNQKLHIFNAYQNTETADFLGCQRPNRGNNNDHQNDEMEIDIKPTHPNSALFEWVDGPLVQSMKNGDIFLLDEISLADDSVLERLNSVLEPQRLLVLAEKISNSNSGIEIYAHPKFKFLATMNPSGDYGKKELSPALRNRFTEIWVPPLFDRDDIALILNSNLPRELVSWNTSQKIIDYLSWIAKELNSPFSSIQSIRDLLLWAEFMKKCCETKPIEESFYHAGSMVIVDGVGANPLFSSTVMKPSDLKLHLNRKLLDISGFDEQSFQLSHSINETLEQIGIGGFVICKGPTEYAIHDFDFSAPTTRMNTFRVFRALQVAKPILLEGDPGVGKTSLISKIASITGNKLIRINLSEQTDLLDLFGSDLPVEAQHQDSKSSNTPQFSWRDGPFLQAMTNGYWVLLDELNLASQQVLEGLNACLDHRGSVYIPELDKTFVKSPNFRVFGAQNPQQQGGGRKGLPKSFLNRFVKVYIETMTCDDLIIICESLFPTVDGTTIRKVIEFIMRLQTQVNVNSSFGVLGSPWEFNIRDAFRWISLLFKYPETQPIDHLQLIFTQRMRCLADRKAIIELYSYVFGESTIFTQPSFSLTDSQIKIGKVILKRSPLQFNQQPPHYQDLHYLLSTSSYFEAISTCIDMNWLTILNGPSGCGKSSLIRLLASLTGTKLIEYSMNESVDSLEILGGFEQYDRNRDVESLKKSIIDKIKSIKKDILLGRISSQDVNIVANIENELSKSIETCDLELIQRFVSTFKEDYSNIFQSDIVRLSYLINTTTLETLGQFEWIDSSIIKAIEKGDWVLIDQANRCSPSVLDRLNSLFEPNGCIVMNERGVIDGDVKIIYPHPNFRLFMTMDPSLGDVSRAIRNRGIEIYMLQDNIASFEGLDDQALMDLVHGIDNPKKNKQSASGKIYLDFLQRGITDTEKVDCLMFSNLIDINYSDLRTASLFFDFALKRIHHQQDIGVLLDIAYEESLNCNSRLLSNGLTNIIKFISTENKMLLEQMDSMKTFNQNYPSVPTHFLRQMAILTFKLEYFSSMPSTILNQSISYTQGSIFESQLTHDSIKYIYPLIKSLHEFNLTNYSNLLDLEFGLKIEERIINVINQESLNEMEIWMILIDLKSYEEFTLLNQTLLSDLVSSLDCNHLEYFKCVWNDWKSIISKNQDQFKVFQRISMLYPSFVLDFQNLSCFKNSFGLRNDKEKIDIICDLFQATTQSLLIPSSITDALDRMHDLCNFKNETHTFDFEQLESKNEYYRVLERLMLNHLNEGILHQTNIEWIQSTSPPNEFYDLLVSSFLSIKVIQNFRSDLQSPCTCFSGVKFWLSTIWDRNFGISNQLFQPQSMNLLLNQPDTVDFSSLIQKDYGMGPQLLLKSLLVPSANHFTFLKQHSLLEHSSFMDSWLSKTTDYILRSNVIKSETTNRLFSIKVFLVFLEMITRVLSIPLGLDLDSYTTREILLSLSNLKSNPIVDSIDYLTQSISEFEASFTDNSNFFVHIGKSFTFIGLSIINTIFKTKIIDPIQQTNIHHAQLEAQYESNQDYLSSILTLRLNSGVFDYETASFFSKSNEKLIKSMESLESSMGYRADGLNISRLSQDIDQLIKGSLNPDIICEMMDQNGDYESRCQIVSHFQNTLSSGLDRIENNYEECIDILIPLIGITSLIRAGVSITLQSNQKHSECASLFIRIMNIFNTTFVILDELIYILNSFEDMEQKTNLIFAIIEKTIGSLKIQNDPSKHDILEFLFKHLLDLWTDKKERDDLLIQERESFYKFKVEETEDVIVNYQTDIENALEEYQDVSKIETIQIKEKPIDYESVSTQLGKYHSELYGISKPNIHCISLWKSVQDLFIGIGNDATSEIDPSLKLLLLKMLNEINPNDQNNIKSTSLNFYQDPNPQELPDFYSILEELDSQLSSLLEQWPENFILLQVRKVVKFISKTSTTSPIIKFLNSAEILLMKCQEWENYASSKHSLDVYMSKLIGKIIHWRKMELESWNRLMDGEDARFLDDANRFWFHLFNIFVLGSMESKVENMEYFTIVSQVSNEFVLSCKLGGYAFRIDILKTFIQHLNNIIKRIKDIGRIKVIDQVIYIIQNTVDYYSQFSSIFSQKLTTHYKNISKKIKDFTKIASWKDVNVFALKETALKSHRQLNKYLKLYRMALSIPIIDVLKEIKLLQKSIRNISPKKITLPPSPIFIDIKESQKIIKLSESFNDTGITLMSLGLENLTTQIIDYILEFQQENKLIESDKAIKGYKARRRKALSDLFKHLKSLGISKPLHLFVISELVKLPSLESDCNDLGKFTQDLNSKCHDYHFKCMFHLQELTTLSDNIHADISSHDFERMSSSTCHLYELSYQQTSSSHSLIKHLIDIKRFTDGLPVEPGTCVKKDSYLNLITNLVSFMGDFIHHMNQLTPLLQKLNNHFETLSIFLSTFNDSFVNYHRILNGWLDKPHAFSFILLTTCDLENLNEIVSIFKRFGTELESFIDMNPQYDYILLLFIELYDTFKHINVSNLFENDKTLQDMDTIENTNKLVNQIVHESTKVIKTFCKQIETSKNEDETLLKTLKKIELEPITQLFLAIKSFIPQIPRTNQIQFIIKYCTLLKHHLKNYHIVLSKIITQFLSLTKSTYKLTYILTNLFTFMINNGFNIPLGHDEQEENQDQIDGMGLADGTAEQITKDDIDDIDFEDGLNQTNEQPNDPPPDKNNDTIDVDHDFEATLEDVDDQDEQDEQEDVKSEDEKSQCDMDDEMDELCDGNVIDEKKFDTKDEKSDEESKEIGNQVYDNENIETVAGDDSKQHEPDQEDDDQDGQDDIEEEHIDENDENDLINDIDLQEENHGIDVKENEMDIDQNDNEDGEEVEDVNEGEEDDKNEGEGDDIENINPDQDMEENDTESVSGDVDQDTKEIDDSEVIDDMTNDINSEDGSINEDNEEFENNEINLDNETGVETEEKQNDIEEKKEKEKSKGKPYERNFDINLDNQNQNESNDMEKELNESSQPNDESMGVEENQVESGGVKPDSQPKEKKPFDSDKKNEKPLNAMKSMADIQERLKMWLEDMSEPTNQDEEMKESENATFANEDEETENVVIDANRNETNIKDRKDDENRTQMDESERIEKDKTEQDEVDEKELDINNKESEMPMENKDDDETETTNELIIQNSFKSTQLPQSLEDNSISQPQNNDEIDLEHLSLETITDDQPQSESMILDETEKQKAIELWNTCTQQTNSLAFTLCEQLRLILEPTLATKYRGDYRTGKRLNMRKIIPYIASHYKKDKIWMKRTKPAKRTYQIVLSIDDSKSMVSKPLYFKKADSGCTEMAFQSLAMISKALNQLEAGDLSVVGFGSEPRLLSPFGTILNDKTGPQIIQEMRFDQDKTDVHRMLNHVFNLLETARRSTRQKDLWQLLLVISDGVCNDHTAIRSLVSKATDLQIMTVFIVLDNRPDTDSITKMASVSYSNDLNTGESILKMDRYMDTFPFEYYIILKDINGLPRVLSESLRQYFAFVTK